MGAFGMLRKISGKTRAFLEKDTLDDFTHNKAIQKIRESYRVSKGRKRTTDLFENAENKIKEKTDWRIRWKQITGSLTEKLFSERCE